MNSNLKRAIESICLNRDSGTWDSLDEEALLGLIEEFGQDDLADKLYREIPKVIPFEVVCDLFNILAWRTDDNGSSVTRAIERWLRTGPAKAADFASSGGISIYRSHRNGKSIVDIGCKQREDFAPLRRADIATKENE